MRRFIAVLSATLGLAFSSHAITLLSLPIDTDDCCPCSDSVVHPPGDWMTCGGNDCDPPGPGELCLYGASGTPLDWSSSWCYCPNAPDCCRTILRTHPTEKALVTCDFACPQQLYECLEDSFWDTFLNLEFPQTLRCTCIVDV